MIDLEVQSVISLAKMSEELCALGKEAQELSLKSVKNPEAIPEFILCVLVELGEVAVSSLIEFPP